LARSISRCSEVSWSPPAITQNLPLALSLDVGEPAVILLFVNQHIIRLRRAEACRQTRIGR